MTTVSSALRIVEDIALARETVLRREPVAEPVLPSAMQQSIDDLWGEPVTPAEHVRRIIEAVRTEGDAAVTRFTQQFDGSSYASIEVGPEEIVAAFEQVTDQQRDAIDFAVQRVRRYHELQMEHAPTSFNTRGTGMIVRPLERAGVYMTGAEAALPSSVVHTAVPANVAGVHEVIGVTSARADGSVNPLKLVAARLSGIERIYRASGAQALAALAYGTETIPRVDKIFGPGGVFVTLAKQQLFGRVGIDALYGPTETLVLADESASPDLAAADLLAQAEHDVLATPVLITTSRAFAEAALPSSVVHTAVPANVAGVHEVIGVTSARADGSVNPLKLVAARLSGIERIYRASGAQALAALAYGTETIPRVDKIFGPGGVFVTLAKQQLFGRVGIDALYGPTETLVLADESASPDLAAADLLAQAEHDVLATPVLITTSRAFAEAVAEQVEAQLPSLEREAIARAAVQRGGAVVAADLEQALALANEFAPEHLCLLVEDAEALLPKVRNAGGIFVGESSPEVLGDYTAGPSHVMPTGGSARFASPLSVLDFLRVTSVVHLSEEDVQRVGPFAADLARAEGLTAHARSIERRLEGR